MQGPEWLSMEMAENNEMCGIIPRTGSFIFEEIHRLNKQGHKFTLEASCFEIYCEDVRDLLAEGGLPLKLVTEKNGSVLVTNLQWEPLSSSS